MGGRAIAPPPPPGYASASTNQNIHIYFIMNKTISKKAEGYKETTHCAMPPFFIPTPQSKKVQNIRKNRAIRL